MYRGFTPAVIAPILAAAEVGHDVVDRRRQNEGDDVAFVDPDGSRSPIATRVGSMIELGVGQDRTVGGCEGNPVTEARCSTANDLG